MSRFIIVVMLVISHYLMAVTPPDSIKNEFSILKPALYVTGFVSMSFLLDNSVNKSYNSGSSLRKIGRITDYAGEKTIVIPTLLLTYGMGRFVTKDERLQVVSIASIKSVVVTAVFTESIKLLAGRARPFTDEGTHSFHPFPGRHDEYKSMPSGHSSLAFAVFTPFAESYSRWIYVIPVSVAAGRVFQNKHWVSDVAVGSGIGFLTGYLFSHYRKNVEPIPNGLVIYF